MKRHLSESGYSLIEFMAAMALMTILSAFAVPMVSSTTTGIKLRDQANARAEKLSGADSAGASASGETAWKPVASGAGERVRRRSLRALRAITSTKR